MNKYKVGDLVLLSYRGYDTVMLAVITDTHAIKNNPYVKTLYDINILEGEVKGKRTWISPHVFRSIETLEEVRREKSDVLIDEQIRRTRKLNEMCAKIKERIMERGDLNE